MKLKPDHDYTFFRVDEARNAKEKSQGIKYHYIGEILSDSWGSGEPKDRLLWDEDANSGDYWKYSEIYPELIAFVNQSIKEGYLMCIGEGITKDGKYGHVQDYELKGEIIE